MKWSDARSVLWKSIGLKKDSDVEKSKLSFLTTVPFFEHLSTWQLSKVAGVIHIRDFEPNECLFEYGTPGAALFIIWSGEVSIEVPAVGDKMTEIARLSNGSFLGELALLDDAPRSATARALKKTRGLALFRKNLDELIQSDPAIASQILKTLAQIIGQRLKDTNELMKLEEAA